MDNTTLIIKGLTGYIAGKICFFNGAKGNSKVQNIVAFAVGGLISLFGYFVFNWLVFYGFHPALLKMIASSATTGIGVAVTIPVSLILKPVANKSGVKIYEEN